MNRDELEAYWNDCYAQEMYVIYQDGEKFGMIIGHDAEHAVHKMAQHEEIDPHRLTAKLERVVLTDEMKG